MIVKPACVWHQQRKARIAGMLAVAVLGLLAVGVSGAALDQRLGQMPLPNEIT